MLAALTIRQLRTIWRNPVQIGMGIALPLVYLGLYAPLLAPIYGGREAALQAFVPGMMVFMAFSVGLFSGFGVVKELRFGVIDRFRMAPMSRGWLLLPFLIKDVGCMLVQTSLFLLCAWQPPPWSLYPILILLVVMSSSFSYGLALKTKAEDKITPLIQGVLLPMLLLSGVLLPMVMAPAWLKSLAHCNPLYYSVEAARGGPFWQAFFVALLGSGASIFWAIRLLTKE